MPIYLAQADFVDLTKYASHVYVLVRKGELRASKIMAKRLVQHPKVTVMWNTVATECKGDGDLLQSLALENTKTGETSELQVNGLFYAIGMSVPLAIAYMKARKLTFRSRARYFPYQVSGRTRCRWICSNDSWIRPDFRQRCIRRWRCPGQKVPTSNYIGRFGMYGRFGS